MRPEADIREIRDALNWAICDVETFTVKPGDDVEGIITHLRGIQMMTSHAMLLSMVLEDEDTAEEDHRVVGAIQEVLFAYRDHLRHRGEEA